MIFNEDDECLGQNIEGLVHGRDVEGARSIHGLSFSKCNFINCQFDHSDLSNAVFRNCRFTACRLTVPNLQRARFKGVVFEDCHLGGIDWSASEWVSPGITFMASRLDNCSFYQQKLIGLAMHHCRIENTDFVECDLSKANFDTCTFSAGSFRQCRLSDTDFRTAQAYVVDPRNNQLKGARFRLPEAVSLLEFLGINLD
jgi:uncharacterized protein YjbI with pentapeptide repeats